MKPTVESIRKYGFLTRKRTVVGNQFAQLTMAKSLSQHRLRGARWTWLNSSIWLTLGQPQRWPWVSQGSAAVPLQMDGDRLVNESHLIYVIDGWRNFETYIRLVIPSNLRTNYHYNLPDNKYVSSITNFNTHQYPSAQITRYSSAPTSPVSGIASPDLSMAAGHLAFALVWP